VDTVTLGFELDADQPGVGGIGRWIEVSPEGAQTSLMLADAAGWNAEDRIGKSADVTLLSSALGGPHSPSADPRKSTYGARAVLPMAACGRHFPWGSEQSRRLAPLPRESG
jgi:hypothetical protein